MYCVLYILLYISMTPFLKYLFGGYCLRYVNFYLFVSVLYFLGMDQSSNPFSRGCKANTAPSIKKTFFCSYSERNEMPEQRV